MLRALFLALNVRPGEEKQVLLLLGKGFFMGIFLATYQVTAETLFLNRLQDYLKEAILISGFLGIITTSVFAFLQGRINFSKLALGNLLGIFLFTAFIYTTFRWADADLQDYIVFLMFAMIGPILAVALLGFWGTFGRLFNLRQSKRIIGGIDVGQLVAAIIALYTVPFLEPFIPNTYNFLIISGVSLLISFVFLMLITTRHDLSEAEISTDTEEKADTGLLALAKDNYVRLLSIFLFFSMVTFTFVQFSFQEVVAEQYPDETELRNFIATFQGSILVVGLLLQTFVNDRIIGEYGLKIALMVLPIIVFVFTIGAIVAGSFFGATVAAGANFIWFFLFIALSRLFNFSLRDSLENPTFKLYFMPLDARVRFDVQTKVEGVVNETSRFIAGALILGLSFLTFFERIHYSYALLIVLVLYFFIVGKIYNEYRNRIRLKLERQQRAIANTVLEPGQQLVQTLSKSLVNDNANKVIFSFKLLEKVEPQMLPESINKLMSHSTEEIRDFAQLKMNELKGLSVSERYVIAQKKNGEDKVKRNIVSGLDMLDLFKSGDISRARLYRLCKSDNPEDRQYAAELISNTSDDENISFLIELLNDVNTKVRKTAIKTAQKKYSDEVLTALIDNLAYSTFSVEAANALTIIGGKALNALDSSFYKSGQSTQTMLKIIQVIGRIGGNKAKQQLWSKIDFPDKVIVSEVLLALANTGFKAGMTQIPRIKYAIESDVENIAWNMASISEVSTEHFGNDIKRALEEEVSSDLDHIYMLLSMLYDAQSIQLVKENIESGTSEGSIYAIELLDVFLSDDLKQRVIPVLDDLPYSEKTKKLEIFYPRDRLSNKLVLKFILNRDFSQINRWTKACVLYQIGLMKIEDYKLDLIANLFNPDQLIYEMAAWALHEIDEKEYAENVSRLPFKKRKHLDSLVLNSEDSKTSLAFEKVLFLEKMDAFSDVSGLSTARVVDIIDLLVLEEGEMLSIDEHYNDNFYIVYEGSINIYENGKVSGGTKKGEFIGELMKSSNYMKSNLIIAVEPTVLFKLNKDSFYELLSDNVKLAQKIVEYV